MIPFRGKAVMSSMPNTDFVTVMLKLKMPSLEVRLGDALHQLNFQ
jgi:hypothetical protein